MILTDFYFFERREGTIAKTRMDCTCSTRSYPEFEEKRKSKSTKQTEKRDAVNVDDLIIYLSDVPPHFGSDNRRKTDKIISIGGKNISSIYIPDLFSDEGGWLDGYGDVKGTADALLFILNVKIVDGVLQDGSSIQVYVARGQSAHKVNLYNLLIDGELEEDIAALRELADLDPSLYLGSAK